MVQTGNLSQTGSAWRIPVLLTSSVVAHDTRVALTHTPDRIAFALESVACWLELYPQISLVLCDGSNHDFSAAVSQAFPTAQIECICFENDQQAVRQQGRGFGEGEIVRYALAHSHMIAAAGAFAKCSSKLWVSNYDECLRDWNGELLCKAVFDNVFSPFKGTSLAYIDTRFYIASVAFYRQHFQDAHLSINVAAGKGLEECFLEAFNHRQMQGVLLNVPPVIEGVGGGIGKHYKTSLKRRLKERLRLHIVRSQSTFAPLFATPIDAK